MKDNLREIYDHETRFIPIVFKTKELEDLFEKLYKIAYIENRVNHLKIWYDIYYNRVRIDMIVNFKGDVNDS